MTELDPDVTAPVSSRETPPRSKDDTTAAEGRTVGRYVLGTPIGSGGFGTVYLATDPELDREVAIKLLRPRVATEIDELRRLVREARALAALAHPNVVAVYDLGSLEQTDPPRLFIVMELVRGRSLRAWMAAGDPPLDTRLAVLCDAGRGLAAAHEADIVHRDFKPGNVLVGDDGRIKVADFGLARSVAWDDPNATGPAMDPSSPDALEAVTQAGLVMGTPSYMAPEQVTDGRSDPRSDQFAFCVTAWQVLFDRLPFKKGLSPRARLAAIDRGPTPPVGHAIPRSIVRALTRGLSCDPSDRHRDMTTLLSHLSARPRRVRRRWAVAAAVVVGLGLGALGWHSMLTSRVAACEDPADGLGAVWDERRRREIRAAFSAVQQPYAEGSADRAIDNLDAYARAWTADWRRACDGTGDRDAAATDRTWTCLRARRQELDATASILSDADPTAVLRAPQTTAALTPVDCHESDSEVAASAVHRALAQTLQARMVAARIAGEVGRFDDALDELQRVQTQARAFGLDAVRLRVRAERGILLGTAGRYEEAVEILSATFFAARDMDLTQVAARVAIELVVDHGLRLGDTEQGLAWARHADAAVRRAGDRAEARGTLQWHTGAVHFRRGDLEAAGAEFRDALRSFDQAGKSESSQVARLLQNLASVYLLQGHVDEAIGMFERSIARAGRTLGADHPDIAKTLNNLALARAQRGDLDDAIRSQRRALALSSSSLGPDHPDSLTMLNNVGELSIRAGRYGQARTTLREVLAGRQRALGRDHVDVAVTLNNLALASLRLGEPDVAIEMLTRALRIREAVAPEDTAGFAAVRHNLGEAHLQRRNYEQARQAFTLAHEDIVTAHGPDAPSAALPELGLSLVALATGKRDEAIPRVEQALAAIDPATAPTLVAQGHTALAQALHDEDPARADEHAAAAARVGLDPDQPKPEEP